MLYNASVGFIREVENKFQLGLLDRMQIGFLKEDEVKFHHFNELKALLDSGELKEDDQVINAMVTNKKDFDEGFLGPLSGSPFFTAAR